MSGLAGSTPVVLVADRSYAVGLAALLQSIVQHTRPCPAIFVIDMGLEVEHRRRAAQVRRQQRGGAAGAHGARTSPAAVTAHPVQPCDNVCPPAQIADVHWIDLPAGKMKELQAAGPTWAGYAAAGASAKLALPLLLPQELERALYMDCDMLALAGLEGLLETDLQGEAALLQLLESANRQPPAASQQTQLPVPLVQASCWRQ